MSELRDWIKDIVFIMLFAGFIEVLLPVDSTKRFVRVVLGLFIMLSIIQPALNLINRHNYANQTAAVISGRLQVPGKMLPSSTQQDFLSQQNQMVLEQYKRDFARQVATTIKQLDCVAEVKVDPELEDTGQAKGFGQFKQITVYVRPAILHAKNSSTEVQPVKIELQSGATAKTQVLTEATANKVKKTVVDLFQLKPTQVIIKEM